MRICLTFALSCFFLAGCDAKPPEPPERIRAIKTYTVVEPATGTVRRYSASISAADTSALSFAVAGTVATVSAKQGDRVEAGTLLAALDAKPFELDVQAAQSELNAAQATLTEARQELSRKTQLF